MSFELKSKSSDNLLRSPSLQWQWTGGQISYNDDVKENAEGDDNVEEGDDCD